MDIDHPLTGQWKLHFLDDNDNHIEAAQQFLDLITIIILQQIILKQIMKIMEKILHLLEVKIPSGHENETLIESIPFIVLYIWQ